MTTSTLAHPAYVPVAERPSTHAYDARLTRPAFDAVEILDDIQWCTCTSCGIDAAFVTWRDTRSTAWGLAGIDGCYSDVFGTYCAACAGVRVQALALPHQH